MLARVLSSIAATLLLTSHALAQGYPNRQITMVVPFAVGGPVDNVGRAFADAMRRHLGQPIIIDNKPGAGGQVGNKAVIAAKPDGYTLLIGSAGPLVIAPAAGAVIDVDRQLMPIGLIGESPQILVASAVANVATLRDLIAMAKSKPGTLNYGSAGIGTMPHLAGELLKVHAGIDLLHVPYRGTGAALPDLLSGRNIILFGDITSVLPLVEGGRLKALAITSPKRSEMAPHVPTTAEAGLPNLVTRNWNALMGPAALPAAVITRLSEAMRAILQDAAYLGAMHKQGATALESSPEHLTQYIKAERETLVPIVKAIDLKLE